MRASDGLRPRAWSCKRRERAEARASECALERSGERSDSSTPESHLSRLAVDRQISSKGARRIELAREDGRPAPNQPAPLPLAWCTDVSGIPPESWPALEGLSTLVLDLLRDRSHPTHLTVDEAAGIAGRIGAARTFFIHMSHELKHSELERRLPPGMAPAWDGLILGEDFSLESDLAAAE